MIRDTSLHLSLGFFYTLSLRRFSSDDLKVEETTRRTTLNKSIAITIIVFNIPMLYFTYESIRQMSNPPYCGTGGVLFFIISHLFLITALAGLNNHRSIVMLVINSLGLCYCIALVVMLLRYWF